MFWMILNVNKNNKDEITTQIQNVKLKDKKYNLKIWKVIHKFHSELSTQRFFSVLHRNSQNNTIYNLIQNEITSRSLYHFLWKIKLSMNPLIAEYR